MPNPSQTAKQGDHAKEPEKAKPSVESIGKDPVVKAVHSDLHRPDWDKLPSHIATKEIGKNGESSLPKHLDLSDSINLWGGKKDSKDVKDGADKTKDKPKDSDYESAREKFLPHLRDRLKDNPGLLHELENRLAKMETRVLKENVKTDKGEKIDQKDQLRQWYENQTRIAQKAEALMDKAGSNGQPIFNRSDVNEILASNIIRGENPGRRYEQGANNTCAAESTNRQFATLLIGDESKSMADMLTKGQFQAVDKNGQEFTCKVDRPSMRLDRAAKQLAAARINSQDPAQFCSERRNSRDAAGEMGDLRTSQLNNSLMGRNEIGAGGENLYTYQKRFSGAQNDTGERIAVNAPDSFKSSRPGEKVVNTQQGKFLYETNKEGKPIGPVMSPDLNGDTLGAVKQSLMGKLGKNFGKDTTILSDAAFGSLENATSCKTRAQMDAHFDKLHSLYGDSVLPTVATHVGNYLNSSNGLGGAEGWHAWSVDRDKDGNYGVLGSWGGEHESKLSSDKLFSYMQAPPPNRLAADHPDRQRRDHVFYPDRPDPSDPSRAIRRDTGVFDNGEPKKVGEGKDPNSKDDKDPKDKETIARKEEKEKAEEQKHKQQEIQYAMTASKQLEAEIASTTDASKLAILQAQKKYYDSLIRQV